MGGGFYLVVQLVIPVIIGLLERYQLHGVMKESLERIAAVRKIIDENNADTIISVDGGINDETAPLVVKAGASYLVAGSRVFSNSDHSSAVKELLSCALS